MSLFPRAAPSLTRTLISAAHPDPPPSVLFPTSALTALLATSAARGTASVIHRDENGWTDGENRDFSLSKCNGVVTLAKVLVFNALRCLPGDHSLCGFVSETRADVMEFVSACVTALMRARATQDF